MESLRDPDAVAYVYASTGELSYWLSNSVGHVPRVCKTGKEGRCWFEKEAVVLIMADDEASMLYCLVLPTSCKEVITSRVSEFTCKKN